jgi:hypothetical protein
MRLVTQRLAGITWLAVFLAIYLPVVGQGFVKDDFGWINGSRVRSAADVARVLTRSDGFYRPAVGVSFALDELAFGNRPLGYGLTNVALALAVGVGLFFLGRALGLSKGSSIVLPAIWLMNFHGMTWGVQWLSGRTSLLACCGAVWAAMFALRGQFAAAAIAFGVGLFAKEEALFMGPVIAAWVWLLRPADSRRRDAIAWFGVAAIVTAAYLYLRQKSGAMVPSSAPWYYTFSFSPSQIASNALEYIDRLGTTSILVVIGAVAALGWPAVWPANIRRLFIASLLWIAGGLGLTLFLPVRSDLYALLPSIGAVVAAGAVCDAAWQSATIQRRRIALVLAIIAPLALSPIYYLRTSRWLEMAQLSTSVLTDLDVQTRQHSDIDRVILGDDRGNDRRRRANLDSTFGNFLPLAFEFWTGRGMDITVAETAADAAASAEHCGRCAVFQLQRSAGAPPTLARIVSRDTSR